MKKYNLYIILYLLFCISFTGCEKSNIPYYNDDNAAVKFPDNVSRDGFMGYNVEDRVFYISYSFLEHKTSNKEFIIYDIPVMLIGNTYSVDRSIAYSIDLTKSTAPQGSYEIIESIMPLNKYVGYIRMKIYNTIELENTTYEVHVSLKNSEELAAGPKEFINGIISWNNQIPDPNTTSYIRTYNMLIKGETNFISTSKNSYSNKALRVIVDALNWNNWDNPKEHALYNKDGYRYLPSYGNIYNDNSYQSYSIRVGEYIKEYNSEHPEAPLLHDGGKNRDKPIEARYTSY